MKMLKTYRKGVTLVELLCVMAIIGILMSLLLPTFARALHKARGLGSHLGGSGGVTMRIDEVASSYTRYRAAHPTHGRMSRQQFIEQLHLSDRAAEWLKLGSVEYLPFAGTDPLTQVAIICQPSSGSGSGDRRAVFSIRELIVQ